MSEDPTGQDSDDRPGNVEGDEPRRADSFPEREDDIVIDAGEGEAERDITATDLAETFARLGANEAFRLSDSYARGINNIGAEILKNFRPIDLSKILPAPALTSLIDSGALNNLARTAYASSALRTAKILEDSVAVPSLYSKPQLERAAAAAKKNAAPRASRSAAAFFSTHEVEIDDVATLLKALYKLQSVQHEHRLVWRGQQDATWEVHSSLHRRLAKAGPVTEDRRVEAEREALRQAAVWGETRARPLEFFADLQHFGAPTRLIDVSSDPEVACWFAVEQHPDHDAADALVLAWGRAPRVGDEVAASDDVTADTADVPFWHGWDDDEKRSRLGWGTATQTWTWFPPALSERMRAQRAGFLLEAGPILTSAVTAVFNEHLPQSWRASEIARVTSIVGLPSPHDVRTTPNKANLVPLFTLRILADAKEPIRRYLEAKGLRYSAVYPDIGGLVQHLNGPAGPS